MSNAPPYRTQRERVGSIERSSLGGTPVIARESSDYRLRLALYAWREPRERLFAVGSTPEPSTSPELHEQMEYFSTTLDELFSTLKEHLPPQRILVVRHPHLEHQMGARQSPGLNRRVGDLVGSAAARNGISFFDSQDELQTRFADHPERYYWEGDMHFNFEGIRIYGELVGREVHRKLETSR